MYTLRHARRARTAMLVAGFTVFVMIGLLTGSGPAGAAGTPPTFVNFAAPSPLGRDAGEPSIGANWATGNVMLQAGFETLRVNGFNEANGTASWTNVAPLLTSIVSLDPILYTDHRTNRTFVSQLSANCSLMAFTDNDGATWTQNPVGCGIAAAADHQTVGGGPFTAPLTGVGYQDSVYYCAQAIATATCALSVDGGLTFGPGAPLYTALACGGLHGHVKVAPDGTAYVPNADCGGKQAVVVSTNNGLTWTVRSIPGTTTQDESDPSIGIGSGGTVYAGYQNGDGHAGVAVSRDHGATWTNVQDVGASLGIQNVQFPAVVAGDDDRAAFAFLGTTTGGDDQKSTFAGVWHLYVAATYDGGVTWSTVDATPGDPVQRGCIWLGGGSNKCRNLLDFMDITTDQTGRILVGYADGCVGACVTGGPNSYTAIATIARQSGGTDLIAP